MLLEASLDVSCESVVWTSEDGVSYACFSGTFAIVTCQMVPYLGVWEREDGIGKGPSDTPILPVLWRMNIELLGVVLKG